jgi:aminoglycoside 3-N-acetyltransferase
MIRTSSVKLLEILSKLCLRSGENVMIHSSLFSLGLIENGINGFFEAVLEKIGPDGTLIVPTFTYSFRRGEVFDVLNTPSAKSIGIFSEFVRNQPSAVRCPDPLFSMAAIGPQANELMQRTGNNCFGINSTYQRLFESNVLFVAIGISYSTGLAGFMHLEKLANVPYREDMTFSGKSCGSDGSEYDDSAIHFVRNDSKFGGIITDREPMGKILEQKGVSRAISYGYGQHMALHGQEWEEVVLNELNINPFLMLDRK